MYTNVYSKMKKANFNNSKSLSGGVKDLMQDVQSKASVMRT